MIIKELITKTKAVMNLDYLCPKCKGHLRVGDQIILTVKNKYWSGGVILMHPELGNYKFENHPSFKFEEGERFDFYCPICLAKLTSKHHEDLILILMRDEKNETYEVLFSRIKGEESTYHVIGKSVDVFGKDSDTYIDYINLSQSR